MSSFRNARMALLAALALAGTLATGSVQARDVQWSIGIQGPLDGGIRLGTVISNGPVYLPAPPIVHYPSHRGYRAPPPRVVYVPQPVYTPRHVVREPVYVYGPPRHARQHDDRRWDDRRDRRDDRHHRRHDRRDDRRGDRR
jgi:hypothetical protein